MPLAAASTKLPEVPSPAWPFPNISRGKFSTNDDHSIPASGLVSTQILKWHPSGSGGPSADRPRLRDPSAAFGTVPCDTWSQADGGHALAEVRANSWPFDPLATHWLPPQSRIVDRSREPAGGAVPHGIARLDSTGSLPACEGGI